jgi:hypothetical protein
VFAVFVAVVLSLLPQEGILFALLCAVYVPVGRRFFRRQRPYWIAGGLVVTLLTILPAIASTYFLSGVPSPANK